MSTDLPTQPSSLRINEPAPQFSARTTMGERTLASYAGKWLLFFSHPADFTPVCTSEFIAFARAFKKFQNAGCQLLGLSVDSLYAHLAWIRDIRDRFDVEIPFPIVEDPTMAIARAYGMISGGAGDSSTTRAAFIIDPDQMVRAIVWYPLNVGRNVDELLRLVQALKESDATHTSTPEGWRPGDALLEPAPTDCKEALVATGTREAWYYRTRKPKR